MKSLKGHLLLASMNLQDPNFRRSILLIVQHDENGAMGLILNRPTRMTIAQAWSQISEDPCLIEAPLYQGGPCEGPLIVLHSRESMSQIPVMDGVYCSTDAQNVSWLVENSIDPVKFFVGYAGWEAGQLEVELGESAWLIAPASSDAIFETRPDAWSILMKRLTTTLRFPNINPKLIPPDPSVN